MIGPMPCGQSDQVSQIGCCTALNGPISARQLDAVRLGETTQAASARPDHRPDVVEAAALHEVGVATEYARKGPRGFDSC